VPKIQPVEFPYNRELLYEMGVKRVQNFCTINKIPTPKITSYPLAAWNVGACAYYRPDTEAYQKYGWVGINICIAECAYPAPVPECRNWSWPGSVTDREPYGVLCHELGHHCDWITGSKKSSYSSEYCVEVMESSKEPPITSYCPNPAEWFAEMFRLFVTNPGLLKVIRPNTFQNLCLKFKPIGTLDWRTVLGSNVPPRIIRTLVNKGAK